MTDELTTAPRAPWMILIPPPALGAGLSLLGWAIFALAGLQPVGWLMIWPVGLALVIAGLALAVWGVVTFARIGAQLAPHARAHSTLVIRGPFRFTRNPMYLGILIMLIGVPLASGNVLQFAAPVIFFVWINFLYIPFEQDNMARQFGEAYEAYKARVRPWI